MLLLNSSCIFVFQLTKLNSYVCACMCMRPGVMVEWVHSYEWVSVCVYIYMPFHLYLYFVAHISIEKSVECVCACGDDWSCFTFTPLFLFSPVLAVRDVVIGLVDILCNNVCLFFRVYSPCCKKSLVPPSITLLCRRHFDMSAIQCKC